MSNHTPGPWKIEWESCDCSEYGCSHGSYPTRIIAPAKRVNVSWSNGTAPAYIANLTESPDTTNADVYLIAAAPDLLAACEAALIVFADDYIVLEEVEMLEAAIAKAKGGQSE